MSEGTKKQVDTNSNEFKRGLEAGLNSKDDTKNWEAGNELGQELKGEGEKNEPVDKRPSSSPLFETGGPQAKRENLQDEKDETAE